MPDLNITMTAQQAQRLAAALGRRLGLKSEQGVPRSATTEEVKAFVVQQMRDLVHQNEKEQAAVSSFDPT